MVEPTETPDADRFWRFALAVYLPEEALFLRLQDTGGMDVPLTLFCLWCGSEGLTLSEPVMREAIAFSDAWRRDRVEPLRTLRRAWKDTPGALSEAARQQVAAAEQAIERLQMTHLATLRHGITGAQDAPVSNLALYCRLAALTPAETDLTHAARLQ